MRSNGDGVAIEKRGAVAPDAPRTPTVEVRILLQRILKFLDIDEGEVEFGFT